MTTDAARESGPPPMASRDLWTTIIVIAATWGTAFGFIRVLATDGVPPLAIAALRALGTAAVLLLWFVATRRTIRIDRATARHMAVLGLLNGLVPNFLTALALDRIASAPAALLQASTPLFAAVAAHLALPAERLSLRAVAGLSAGFLGVFLLAGPQAVLGGSASAVGASGMLGAALSYALATVYLRWTRPPDPVSIALGQQAFAAAPATALVLLTEPVGVWALNGFDWACVAGLAVVATALPIVLYFRLVARAPAGKAASVQYLLPVAATVYGVTLLHERLPPNALVGGAVVLLGVWVVNTRPKPTVGGRQ